MLKVGDQAPDIPGLREPARQARGAVLLSEGGHAGLHAGILRIPRPRAANSRRKAPRWSGFRRTNRAAQEKFKTKYNLPFVLLSDDEKAAAQAFGVWKEKTMYGKKVMGIERSTFVIGPDGKIEKIYAKVKPAGHAAEVLQDL